MVAAPRRGCHIWEMGQKLLGHPFQWTTQVRYQQDQYFNTLLFGRCAQIPKTVASFKNRSFIAPVHPPTRRIASCILDQNHRTRASSSWSNRNPRTRASSSLILVEPESIASVHPHPHPTAIIAPVHPQSSSDQNQSRHAAVILIRPKSSPPCPLILI
jgi:hypothetical protein